MSADHAATADEVSQLRRHVAELEADVVRYRAALAGGRVGVWESDPDRGTVAWDPATENLYGLPPASFVGTRDGFYRRMHPDDRDRVRELVRLSLAGNGTYAAEFRIARADGATRWHAVAGRVLPTPDAPNRLVGIAVDVTDRKEAEGRLRESEERYATTLRSIGDGVIATDAIGRVTLLNPVAEGLTGWTQAEAAGRPVDRMFRIVRESTREPVEGPLRKVLATGRAVGLANAILLVRRDGTEVPIDDSAAPIRDADGRLTGAVLVFRDVSERKKLEEQLRQAQKMEAVGRLAGGVAHDFNNLLTVINGNAQLLAETLPAGHPARTFADEILKAGEKAAGITAQLLTFSRKQQLRPRAFDLNRRVAELEKLFARLIGSHIRVMLDLSHGQGPVRADPSQVEQVVMNLVLNARDAMPHGGILTVRTDTFLIPPGGRRELPLKPGTYRRLIVADTGVGMDAATRGRAFEPFFTTKGGRGTGLGLATVYSVVRQSGGHITVESAPGQGTAFTVYLPAATTAVAVDDTPTPDAPPKGRETILLVEDEEGVRKLAKTLLEEAGYTVLPAKDGLEARNLVSGRLVSIDLLFTDIVLPGMNGVELWRGLSAERPGLKVLFTSGYADPPGRLGPELPGRMLQKPYKPDELTRRVREVLDTV